MPEMTFTFPGEAVPKLRHRDRKIRNRNDEIVGVIRHPDPRSKNFESVVKWAAMYEMRKNHWPMFPKGAMLLIAVRVYRKIPKSASKVQAAAMARGELRPTTRPDTDNYEKTIYDAFNGIVFPDDSQIVGHLPGDGKFYDDGKGPRVEVIIQQFDGVPE